MATSPIYAGGSRRSAAPQVTQTAPQQTAVSAGDDLLGQLVASMQTYAAQQQAQPGALSFQSDGGGGGNYTAGPATSGVSVGNPLGQISGLSSLAGNIAGNVGVLSRDADLAQFGSTLATIGSLTGAADKLSRAETVGEVASAVAPIGLRALNVPSAVGGAVTGGLKDGVPGAIGGAVRGGLYAAAPPLAAVDMVLGLFGVPNLSSTIQGMVDTTNLGKTVDPSMGLLDSYAMGTTINAAPNPMDALMVATNAFGTEQPSSGGSWSAADLGTLGSYGFNSSTMDLSNVPGRDYSGGSSNSGGGWGSGEGADGHGGMADSAMGGGYW